MIQYRINSLFWETNQEQGYRKIHVHYDNKCIAIFNSVLSNNKWVPVFVPMGFSFNENTYMSLVLVSQNISTIFDLLSRSTLELSEVQEILNNL